MRKRTGIMVVCAMLLAGQPAWAMRTTVHQAAESQDYGRKFGGMIGRGILNALTCFVDVIVNVVNETKAGPPLVGTLTGVAKGTGCGVLRLASGAIDLTTFWVPGFNGLPVSDSYDNCFLAGNAAMAGERPAPAMTQASSAWTTSPASSPEPGVATPAQAEPSPSSHWKK